MASCNSSNNKDRKSLSQEYAKGDIRSHAYPSSTREKHVVSHNKFDTKENGQHMILALRELYVALM